MRSYTIIIGSVICLVSGSIQAGVNHWTVSGPCWAYARQVKVDPQNTDIVYGVAATSGGIFKSFDSAVSWSRASNGLDLNGSPPKAVSTFALDPCDPEYLFCAISDAGLGSNDFVFRSTNGGVIWERVLEVYGPLNVRLNGIDVYDGYVYIGADNQLYYSEDYGETWIVGHMFDSDIRVVCVNPDNQEDVFVGCRGDGGLHRSLDGGDTFNLIEFFNGKSIHHVGVHEIGDNVHISVSGYRVGLYISYDNGETWEERDNGLPVLGVNVWYPYEVAYSPADSNVIYCAISFGGIFKSDDGGLNWYIASESIEIPSPYYSHDDILGTSVECHENDGEDIVYLASDLGIHKSQNGATSWNVVGVPATNIDSFSLNSMNDNIGYAAGVSGVFRYENNEWYDTSQMAPDGVSITTIAVHPSDSQIIIAGTIGPLGTFSLYKSTDSGYSWLPVGGLGIVGQVTSIKYDHIRPTKVYATYYSVGSGGLLISNNGGNTFERDLFFTDPLAYLCTDPNNHDRIYISGIYGPVWTSDNGGNTWDYLSNTYMLNKVIKVDPMDSMNIYIGTNSNFAKLLYSDNGGEYWQDVGLGPGRIKDIDFAGESIFLAANDAGVMAKPVGSPVWVFLNEGLADIPVNTIWAEESGSNVQLYTGTTGMSVCEMLLTGPTDVDYLGLQQVKLLTPWPNPFNPRTTIEFTLVNEGRVKLAVYDLLGRKVAVLIDDYRPAGPGSVTWDGRDTYGSTVASGVYIARLETADGVQTRKLVVAR